MKPNILVFDVESTSLHGKGFAVGAVVIEKKTGKELDSFIMKSTQSENDVNAWVKENVLPYLAKFPSVKTDFELRHAFWCFLKDYKDVCDIWVDVGYPVETNFLEEIYNDEWSEREFEMPYPLLDISTIVDVNINRNEFCELEGLELHNPYDDARASAYSLIKDKCYNDDVYGDYVWENIKETCGEKFIKRDVEI